MIAHLAEIWAALAVCFILGALVGSLLHRTIALTGARRLQAEVIYGIDGAVRMLERMLMPWRGSVPTTLPQTVPVPPPDFRHVVEVPQVHPPAEPDRHWEVATAAVSLAPPAEAQRDATFEPAHPTHPRPDETAAVPDPGAGFQPLPLPAPRNEIADPLHLITGLTKRHAGRLGKVGIFHFSQIASWTPQEIAWIAAYLCVEQQVIVEKDWVGQAIHFASSDEPVREPEPKPARAKAPKKATGRRAKAKAPDAVEGEASAEKAKKPAKRRPARAKKETAGTGVTADSVKPPEAEAQDGAADGEALADGSDRANETGGAGSSGS